MALSADVLVRTRDVARRTVAFFAAGDAILALVTMTPEALSSLTLTCDIADLLLTTC